MRLSPAFFAAVALALAGCASKEPMDYLPDSPNYVAVDAAQLRKEAGAKRVSEMYHKVDPNSPTDNEKLTRIYAGFDGGMGGSVYCVMIGEPGMSDSVIQELKRNGAQETKIDGTKAVTIRGMAATSLSDSGLLLFAPATALQKMRNTSKKKTPGAVDSPLFKKLSRALPSHALALAFNTAPMLAMADRPLSGMAMLNPKGVAALKTVDSLTLTLDWDQQPEANGTLYLQGEDSRKDLAEFLDSAKKMAAGQGGAVGKAGALLENMTLTPGTDGTDFSLKIPAETADAWLDGMGKMAASLPSDPQQRALAIHQAIMSNQAGR